MNTQDTPKIVVLAALLASVSIAAPAAAAPPPRTLDLLEEALEIFECWGETCTYTMRFRSVISKTDGTDAEEQTRLMEITVDADGESTTNTLEVLQNGENVTDDEEAQASFGKASEEAEEEVHEEVEEEGGGSMNLELSLPVGDDAVHYQYGDTITVGGLHVTTFEPVDGKSRKELTKLSRGRLAWDPQTLEPRWVEFEYARNPRMVISMNSKLALGQLGGKLVPLSWTTEGVGGLLVFKRKLLMEMKIEGLR